MSLRAELRLSYTIHTFVSLQMFPNMLISPSVQKRHTTALENTVRMTVLPKYHRSSVTTLVTRLKKLKLKHSFCAQHDTKRHFYLHLDVRLGPHANTQTASWFVFFFITHNTSTSCNRQYNALVSSCQMPSLGLKSLKINPKHYSIGSLSFITQRSKLGSASHHLLC